ncbi:hypothetical protein FNV43_RR09011 [Rhamnella rubrinervis]|uniref:Uncharacterized protein n=1 Tax=Rhamnella rubrinervis TaxID=2594499 RepID=A0A8K0MJT6_9ROSA|nr:hypothetical protein FNV43_RR09011 [Rhamnella rubrinervis]
MDSPRKFLSREERLYAKLNRNSNKETAIRVLAAALLINWLFSVDFTDYLLSLPEISEAFVKKALEFAGLMEATGVKRTENSAWTTLPSPAEELRVPEHFLIWFLGTESFPYLLTYRELLAMCYEDLRLNHCSAIEGLNADVAPFLPGAQPILAPNVHEPPFFPAAINPLQPAQAAASLRSMFMQNRSFRPATRNRLHQRFSAFLPSDPFDQEQFFPAAIEPLQPAQPAVLPPLNVHTEPFCPGGNQQPAAIEPVVAPLVDVDVAAFLPSDLFYQ